MTDKEKLKLKIKYLLKLNDDLSNYKEVFEELEKEHPELIDMRLLDKVNYNSNHESDKKINNN